MTRARLDPIRPIPMKTARLKGVKSSDMGAVLDQPAKGGDNRAHFRLLPDGNAQAARQAVMIHPARDEPVAQQCRLGPIGRLGRAGAEFDEHEIGYARKKRETPCL